MFIQAYLGALSVIMCYMIVWYLYALYLRDNSIVDIAWGTIFIIIAWMTLLGYGPISVRGVVVTLLTTVWGARLAAHIYARHTGEDPRYARWRKEWSWVKVRSFFQIFMLQGIIATIIATPVIYMNVVQAPFSLWDVAGVLIWMIGFGFEVIADWQLKQFLEQRDDPQAIMTSGLWRYSRHPNYFGESMIWWGIWLMSLALPYGWLCIVSPVFITYLILYVSGIPLNEAILEDNPAYQTYQKTTSSFIPLPPQESVS